MNAALVNLISEERLYFVINYHINVFNYTAVLLHRKYSFSKSFFFFSLFGIFSLNQEKLFLDYFHFLSLEAQILYRGFFFFLRSKQKIAIKPSLLLYKKKI